MTNPLESSLPLATSRDGLSKAGRARAVALLIIVLGASVSMTLITDYVEGDLGYQQPYFIVYAGHSCLSLLLPLHLAYLSRTANVPVSCYIAELKHTLAQQFPNPGSFGIDHSSLTRTAFASATGNTTAALLWYIGIVFAPISGVTVLASTNAFWTYIISVLASSYCIGSSGRGEHKWEFRKLLAVSMASVGVAAVVYGGSNRAEESTSPPKANGGTIHTATAKPVLLGYAFALASALLSATWAVWYDRSVALPQDDEPRPPTPQSSDGVETTYGEYQRLRTDDEQTRLAGDITPPSVPSQSLPFGLHANFFSWTIGIITFFFFWIPLCLINVLKLGPPVELPPNPKVWVYVGLISVMSLTYNAGSMILLYIWGPVLNAVAGLLEIVLVLAGDALFGKGMQTITAGTLLGSTMIVGAFGLLARDAMMRR
ncbi:hypothetical protein FRC04_005451 [Tulasnella sp. 424]|nr:hypothetical protein FRC04_005451 [Tulasnella sp. 424]KAG8962384.1 hypothetical protein FRC05_005355 [Tulasnella sp. 425]